MTILVLQSFRTHQVPGWMVTCMQGVRQWADRSGFQYEFVDDRLFDLLPAWVREKCKGQLLPQTDLARLLLMRGRLQGGITRVIWLDADMLIFAPADFDLESRHGYGFCGEVWMERQADGSIRPHRRINNSAMVMEPGNPVLDFYIHACMTLISHHPAGELGRIALGPNLLTALSGIVPIWAFRHIGMLSPLLARDIVDGPGQVVETCIRGHGNAMCAINLCRSLVEESVPGQNFPPALHAAAMQRLLDTGGEVINRYLVREA